jgi:hypothetical protein
MAKKRKLEPLSPELLREFHLDDLPSDDEMRRSGRLAVKRYYQTYLG